MKKNRGGLILSKKVKLVIDSINENRIRILITPEYKKKKSIEISSNALKKILKNKNRINEGNSFQVTFQKEDDLDVLVSKDFVNEFKPKGQIKIKTAIKPVKIFLSKLDSSNVINPLAYFFSIKKFIIINRKDPIVNIRVIQKIILIIIHVSSCVGNNKIKNIKFKIRKLEVNL